MPRRVDDFRGLTQPRRMSLLREVQRIPGRGAQELAEKCGMPVNTARDHLHVLVEEGLIRAEPVQTGTRGRPPVVFHPVRERTSSAAAQRRVAESLRRGALVRKAVGEASVDAAAGQIDVLYDHLDDAGLEPVLDESTRTFELAPCNYHQLLDAEQATVCAVHARLVADVLQQVDGPLSVKRLEPFVTEHSCRLTLTDVIPLRPPSA